MRRAIGTTVFSGMIGVTILGLIFTPIFYVLVMKLRWPKKRAKAKKPKAVATEETATA